MNIKLIKFLKIICSPRLFIEKLAAFSLRHRRLEKLKDTPAKDLSETPIDSLELLELSRPLGIKVVYDIGANVGTWSLLSKSVIPEATIEAFEPLEKHSKDFKKNLDSISGVRLHQIALGPSNVTANIHITNHSDSTSMLAVSNVGFFQFGLEEIESVPTTVRCLDDYRAEHNLALPDLIKLDVQGYELEVLKGANKCLKSAKAVIAEVSFIKYYKNQCLFHDLVGYLATYGFYVEAFAICTPLGSTVNTTDVLFLRRNENMLYYTT